MDGQYKDTLDSLDSPRITTIEQMKRWEHSRKAAYRNELDSEMRQRIARKEQERQKKATERQQIAQLVSNERSQHLEIKNSKLKTEQQYMLENYSMMGPARANSGTRSYEVSVGKDHPFVRLVEGQDQRNLQLKKNFIYQNQLNSIQSQLKRQAHLQQRTIDSRDRTQFEQHVEAEFKRKDELRRDFQRKYLQLGQPTGDYKHDYLEYLKREVADRDSRYRQQPPAVQQLGRSSQFSEVSPGSLGLMPISLERQKQLQKIDRTLMPRMSDKMHSSMESSRRSEEFSPVREKSHTEKSQIDGYKPHRNIFNDPPSQTISSILGQSQAKRKYRQFDIILNNDKEIII